MIFSVQSTTVSFCSINTEKNKKFSIIIPLISPIGAKYRPMMVFSIYTNAMKLFSWKMSESPGTIHCLHGIRVIATIWVLLEHNCTSTLYMPIRNAAIELEVIDCYQFHEFHAFLLCFFFIIKFAARANLS